LRLILLCVLALSAGPLLAAPAAPAAAPAAATGGEAGTAALTYDAGALAGNTLTRAKVYGMLRFESRSAGSAISVAGVQLRIAGRAKGSTVAFGVDRNGDGTVTANECIRVVRGGVIRFALTLPDRPPCAVQFSNLALRASKNVVTSMTGHYAVSSCMAGTVNGQQVRLFDDNLDGEFTQDGKDAIAVGRALVAMPLGRTHQIGRDICDLTVAKDGTSIQATPRTDVKLGVVETPISPALLKSLILIGRGGVYDVKTSGKAGVPAGDYWLAFGVLAGGGRTMPFVPTQGRLKYPVTAGMINRLRIGPPTAMRFTATISGDKITINPYALRIVGSGGERYLNTIKDLGKPTVYLLAGSRIMLQKRMEYG